MTSYIISSIQVYPNIGIQYIIKKLKAAGAKRVQTMRYDIGAKDLARPVTDGVVISFTPGGLVQRPYIIEMMHSFTLPM